MNSGDVTDSHVPRRRRWWRVAVAALVVAVSGAAWVASGASERQELPAVLWTRSEWRTGSPFHVAPDGPVVPGWHLDMRLSGSGEIGLAFEEVGPVEQQVRRLRAYFQPPVVRVGGRTCIRPAAPFGLAMGRAVYRFGTIEHAGVDWTEWVAPGSIPETEFRPEERAVGTWRFESFDGGGARDVRFDADGGVTDAATGTSLGTWGEARGFVRHHGVDEGAGWAWGDVHVLSADGDVLLRTTGGREVARRVPPGR